MVIEYRAVDSPANGRPSMVPGIIGRRGQQSKQHAIIPSASDRIKILYLSYHAARSYCADFRDIKTKRLP